MSPETLEMWLKIAVSGLALASFGFSIFATRRKAINERLEAGSKRMDAHDLAIQAMQQQIANMPGKDDFHELQLALAKMSGDFQEVHAQLTANGEMMTRAMTVLERQEAYLLDKSGARK